MTTTQRPRGMPEYGECYCGLLHPENMKKCSPCQRRADWREGAEWMRGQAARIACFYCRGGLDPKYIEGAPYHHFPQPEGGGQTALPCDAHAYRALPIPSQDGGGEGEVIDAAIAAETSEK